MIKFDFGENDPRESQKNSKTNSENDLKSEIKNLDEDEVQRQILYNLMFSNQKTEKIKKWVSFLGIVTLTSIVLSVLIGLFGINNL